MTPLRVYLRDVEKAFIGGNATEHTYRPFLKRAIESMGNGITATNEPRREACGAPDFIITRNKIPLGYIETKDIGKPLAVIENDEQLTRYRNRLGNLILTDYLEFRWYVAGEHRLTARLASEGVKGGLKASAEGAEQVANLLTAFLRERVSLVKSPKDLAVRMAALAQLVRDTILTALAGEDGGGTLHGQMDGFRKVLLPEMTAEQFADMYAQTICYGLFSARCNARRGAASNSSANWPFSICPRLIHFCGRCSITSPGRTSTTASPGSWMISPTFSIIPIWKEFSGISARRPARKILSFTSMRPF